MVLDKFGSITVFTKAMKSCSHTVKMLAKIFLHADLQDSGHFAAGLRALEQKALHITVV